MRYVLIALLLLPVLAAAGAWRIETVDDEGDVGRYNSLALDDLDHPHISYLDSDNRYLKYARWDGSAWQIEIVDSQGIQMGNSLALDSSNHPHISYYKISNNSLNYAYWDETWLIETIDTARADCNSIRLDNNDYPHIAYSGYDNLKYAFWDGSSWQIEFLDYAENAFLETSLALDSSGNPHIAYTIYYLDSGYSFLKYTFWDGDEWQFETIQYEEYGCQYPSLELNSFGYPNITYDNNYLNYVSWDGDDWQIETIDIAGRINSLALDSSDYPHISYYTYYDGYSLKYAQWNGITWQIETVVSEGHVGWCNSLALDSFDNPHISCYDYTNGNLKYAWYDPNGFHLEEPENGEVIDTTMPLLDWEDSPVPDHESFTLWWGTDPDFNDYNEVTGIGESEYQITGGIEDGDRIYWRVKSIDDQSEECWAAEMDWYFDVDLGGGVDIVDFAADAEDEGILIAWRIEGDSPSGLRVLRSIGDEEPIFLHSEPLNGDATKYLDRGVSSGVEYCYWLEVTEADGTVKRFGPTDAVTVPEYIPELILYAAYPNPSRETINFVFSLPDDGRVELSVYDLSGRRLATLVSSDLATGRHEVSWSCADVESGVYLYRLETEAGSITQRLVVSR